MLHLSTTFHGICSDKELKFPEIMQMAPGKHPKPDFATRRMANSTWDAEMSPVVIIGEAKQARTGQDAAGDRDTSKSYEAQMQAAVFPTLLLLILIHLKGKKHEPPLPAREGKTAQASKASSLPPNFFVYGIYYDERSLIIYSHFPYLEKDRANPSDIGAWRFAQVKMGEFTLAHHDDDEQTNAPRRLKLGIALQGVHEHAVILEGIFTAELPHLPVLQKVPLASSRLSESTAAKESSSTGKSSTRTASTGKLSTQTASTGKLSSAKKSSAAK